MVASKRGFNKLVVKRLSKKFLHSITGLIVGLNYWLFIGSKICLLTIFYWVTLTRRLRVCPNTLLLKDFIYPLSNAPKQSLYCTYRIILAVKNSSIHYAA